MGDDDKSVEFCGVQAVDGVSIIIFIADVTTNRKSYSIIIIYCVGVFYLFIGSRSSEYF